MGEAPMTAADVGAVLGNRGNGWGDGMGGGFWIFALIVLAFMGNGGWGFGGNNRGDNALTNAEACNMNSFNELKSQVGRMNDMMFQDARSIDNAICTLGFQSEQQTNQLSSQIAQGTCDLKQLIMQEANETRGLIQANKIEALQNKVSNLEADLRMQNVVRYPSSYVWASQNPFFNCNGCNNTLF